jgi:hypothetical protein
LRSVFNLGLRVDLTNSAFVPITLGQIYSGRVAFLPFVSITRKTLKPNETDFEPRTLGEHIKKKRLELKLISAQASE